VRCKKKEDSEVKIIQCSTRSLDKPTGTAFFKSKMEGWCFNCFSPNHHAHSCHRPPRCWKCYLSGHRAMDCSLNTLNDRSELNKRGRHQALHHSTSSQEHGTSSKELDIKS
jgi:hypothetical protein